MKKIKFLILFLAGVIAIFAIYFVLRSEKTLVIHPKGFIARRELDLILINVALMLSIIIPTFILLLVVAWKYRANYRKTEYASEKEYGFFKEISLWIIPSIIIAIMAVITWDFTHKLDPYKPLKSEIKPMTIQVVALDWKWLFIYPEQNIATVNFVEFPEKTPIHFEIAADGSPMNSFWIPQLSGQIYCMTGMISSLHVIANEPGVYSGKAAEINGKGYAKMTFIAKSTSQSDFNDWVGYVKKSSLQLDNSAYQELIIPTTDHPIEFYSKVEKNLFNQIVKKYITP